MKSKFMRMVGGGVEEPEEEEQVFQEAEQDVEEQIQNQEEKILPQISDAEIDGFYEKFLTTGFTSPFMYDKRRYVLDLFLQMEEFIKVNTNEPKVGGSKKRRRSRLVGGVSKFESLLGRLKKDDLLKDTLIPNINIDDYSPHQIDTVLNNLEDFRDKIIESKDVLNNIYKDEDFVNLLPNKLIDDLNNVDISQMVESINHFKNISEEQFNEEYKDKYNLDLSFDEFKEKANEYLNQINTLTKITSNSTIRNVLNEVNSSIEDFKNAQLTDVSPKQDILDKDKYSKMLLSGQLEEPTTDVETKKKHFFSTYGIPLEAIKNLKTIENDLGINDKTITSSRILKTIQSFETYASIKSFVEDLKYVIEEERNDINNVMLKVPEETYVNYLVKRGIKISKDLQQEMIHYRNPPSFPTMNDAKTYVKLGYIKKNGVFDEDKFKLDKSNYEKYFKKTADAINEARDEIGDNRNPYKVAIKKLFLDTLKYKMIGSSYIDEDGNLTKSKEMRNLIYDNKFMFVNSSDFKGRYNYTTVKELGNVYEYLEAIRYRKNITNIITNDFKKNGYTDTGFLKALSLQIQSHFDKNSQPTRLVYGYYMSDIERVDNVIPFEYTIDNITMKFQINIETKFSGRINSGVVKTLQSKTNYPFVYTGLLKINKLMDEYFKGQIPTSSVKTFSYNTLYFKNDFDVFEKIMSDDNFNVKPDSASMLSIEKFIERLNIKYDDIKHFKDSKKEDNLNNIFDFLNQRFNLQLVDLFSKKYDLELNDQLYLFSAVDEDFDKSKIIDHYKNNDMADKIYQIKNAIKRRGINRLNESIYLDIPALYALNIAYDLELDSPNNFNTKNRETLIGKFYKIDDNYTDILPKGSRVYTSQFRTGYDIPKYTRDELNQILSESPTRTERTVIRKQAKTYSKEEIDKIRDELKEYDKKSYDEFFREKGTFKSTQLSHKFKNEIEKYISKIERRKAKAEEKAKKKAEEEAKKKAEEEAKKKAEEEAKKKAEAKAKETTPVKSKQQPTSPYGTPPEITQALEEGKQIITKAARGPLPSSPLRPKTTKKTT